MKIKFIPEISTNVPYYIIPAKKEDNITKFSTRTCCSSLILIYSYYTSKLSCSLIVSQLGLSVG